MNHQLPDPHVEAFLSRWGAYLNHDLKAAFRPRRRSAVCTPGQDQPKSYWQPCQQCRGTGADLSEAGSGVRSRSRLKTLAKQCPCPVCRGRGGHYEQVIPADPATIRATGPGGMHLPMRDKPLEYVELEAALDSMGLRREAVIYARYVHFPRRLALPGVAPDAQTGGKMARLQWVNERIAPDKISPHAYRRLLADAKRRVGQLFDLPVLKDLDGRQAA